MRGGGVLVLGRRQVRGGAEQVSNSEGRTGKQKWRFSVLTAI